MEIKNNELIKQDDIKQNELMEQISVSEKLELIYSELRIINSVNQHIMKTNDFFVYGFIPIFVSSLIVYIFLKWFHKRFIGI